jgi:methionyl-tRNA formyltransferase
VLDLPAQGCVNIHASLLPRWRGAAPVQRAILAGDARTGITIMQMDAGLDTGDILAESPVEIGLRDTAATLTATLAKLGSDAIVQALATIEDWKPRPQDTTGITYAQKVAKAEGRIDWSRPSIEVDRAVRAFNPFPGAETRLEGETLKIWEAVPVPGSGRPGEVIESANGRLVVACGEGALELTLVQRAGSRRLATRDFLRGMAVVKGATLQSA